MREDCEHVPRAYICTADLRDRLRVVSESRARRHQVFVFGTLSCSCSRHGSSGELLKKLLGFYVLPDRQFAALNNALRAWFIMRVGSVERAHVKITGLENVSFWKKAWSCCSLGDRALVRRKARTADASSGDQTGARSRLRLKSFGSSLCLCAPPF
jgi:hypothetical protein